MTGTIHLAPPWKRRYTIKQPLIAQLTSGTRLNLGERRCEVKLIVTPGARRARIPVVRIQGPPTVSVVSVRQNTVGIVTDVHMKTPNLQPRRGAAAETAKNIPAIAAKLADAAVQARLCPPPAWSLP
jgi:hypothetical protein